MNAIRSIALVLICLMKARLAGSVTPVTVAQLEQFLSSKQATKESDEKIAERLNQVTLSEELAGPDLVRVLTETSSWPKSAEQVELLAAESIFKAPPAGERLQEPAPDPAMQQQVIEEARNYVNHALHLLPDFLAVRVTRCFENTITDSKPKHGKPKVEMHFAGEYRRQIAYRGGHETELRATGQSRVKMGLSTWGEFGDVLKIVLNDAFSGSVAWERWERNAAGGRIAVFHYGIPESASHYSVDFCCSAIASDNPVELPPFHARPGYHGRIFLDPQDGSIERITIEADLKVDDPVRTSSIAVEYGRVDIGGKMYVCPVRGVAITATHNLMMESDSVGLEKHTNLVQFVDYHKFGSTARFFPESTDK